MNDHAEREAPREAAVEAIQETLVRMGYGALFPPVHLKATASMCLDAAASIGDSGGPREAQPTAAEVGVTACAQAFYAWVLANVARLGTYEVEREFHHRLFIVRQRAERREPAP